MLCIEAESTIGRRRRYGWRKTHTFKPSLHAACAPTHVLRTNGAPKACRSRALGVEPARAVPRIRTGSGGLSGRLVTCATGGHGAQAHGPLVACRNHCGRGDHDARRIFRGVPGTTTFPWTSPRFTGSIRRWSLVTTARSIESGGSMPEGTAGVSGHKARSTPPHARARRFRPLPSSTDECLRHKAFQSDGAFVMSRIWRDSMDTLHAEVTSTFSSTQCSKSSGRSERSGPDIQAVAAGGVSHARD